MGNSLIIIDLHGTELVIFIIKIFQQSAGFPGGTHRALSGSVAQPDIGCLHLSSGDHPASTVAGEKQELERQGTGGYGKEAGQGAEHPQAMAALPDVIKRLVDDLKWTTMSFSFGASERMNWMPFKSVAAS